MTVSFEETYAKLPGQGWLTEEEARLLYEIVQKTAGPILEVGCYCGRSTVLLAHLGRAVYSVDPFSDFAERDPTGEQTEKRFRENTKEYSNVILFKQGIQHWTPRPCGFAYLDGKHTYEGTLVQIERALLCNPSYLAVHDVNDKGNGVNVKRACIEKLGFWTDRSGKLATFRVTP